MSTNILSNKGNFLEEGEQWRQRKKRGKERVRDINSVWLFLGKNK